METPEPGPTPPEHSRPILQTVVAVERAVCVVLLVMVLGLTILQVVARYVFDSPFFWTDELARYSYVWLSFIGAAFVVAERSHIAIDVLERTLGRSGRFAINICATLVVIGTCLVMLIGGYDYVLANINIQSPALPITLVWLYGIVYLAFAAIAAHAIVNLIDLIKPGRDSADGPTGLDVTGESL